MLCSLTNDKRLKIFTALKKLNPSSYFFEMEKRKRITLWKKEPKFNDGEQPFLIVVSFCFHPSPHPSTHPPRTTLLNWIEMSLLFSLVWTKYIIKIQTYLTRWVIQWLNDKRIKWWKIRNKDKTPTDINTSLPHFLWWCVSIGDNTQF